MLKRFKALVAKLLPNPVPYVARVLEVPTGVFLLRPMLATDVDDALAIERAIYTRTPWDRYAFLAELQKRGRTLYLACTDVESEKLVAYIGAFFKETRMHITILAVAPEWQHQGLGRQLMGELICVARQQGCNRVTLEVAVDNVPARQLYQQLGFEDGRLRVNYYTAEQKDAIDMTLTLNNTSTIEVMPMRQPEVATRDEGDADE